MRQVSGTPARQGNHARPHVEFEHHVANTAPANFIAPSVGPLSGQHGAHLPAPIDHDLAELNEIRAVIGRFFIDLRAVLRASPPQVAAHLGIQASVIEALENGFVTHLPAWPDLSRVVLTYTALANIDGRAILAAIDHALVLSDRVAVTAHAQQFAHAEQAQGPVGAVGRTARAAVGRQTAAFRAAVDAAVDTGLSSRAKRSMLAVAVPVVLVLAGLNSSAVGQALRPVHRVASDVGDFFKVHFAPVREGHRWIEVRDPRSRRGDKLQIKGG